MAATIMLVNLLLIFLSLKACECRQGNWNYNHKRLELIIPRVYTFSGLLRLDKNFSLQRLSWLCKNYSKIFWYERKVLGQKD